MDQNTIRIPTSKPLANGATEVVLREPTVMEWIRHEIGTVAEAPGGGRMLVENPEAIEALLKICIVEPNPLIVLTAQDTKLVRRLKNGLFDFFRSAGEDDEASGEVSKTSPTNSSSPATDISQRTLSIG